MPCTRLALRPADQERLSEFDLKLMDIDRCGGQKMQPPPPPQQQWVGAVLCVAPFPCPHAPVPMPPCRCCAGPAASPGWRPPACLPAPRSEHLGIPEAEYDATVKLPSSEFQRIVKDLATIGDTGARAWSHEQRGGAPQACAAVAASMQRACSERAASAGPVAMAAACWRFAVRAASRGAAPPHALAGSHPPCGAVFHPFLLLLLPPLCSGDQRDQGRRQIWHLGRHRQRERDVQARRGAAQRSM